MRFRRIITLAAACLASAALASTADAQRRPSAREVVERYVEAIGGREAIRRATHRHTVTEVAMADVGIRMTVETFQARPNLIFVQMEVPGVGPVTSGYNGLVGWTVNPLYGARLLEGSELAESLRQADFDGALDPSRAFPAMRTVGEKTVEGRPCWNVRLSSMGGMELQSCFDKETGLMVGSTIRQVHEEEGLVQVESTISDYREFDGIHMPMKYVTRVLGREMVTTVKSISHAPIAESVFTLPTAIQTIVAQPRPRQ
ncbi:MAG TPA: hypothetical protein VFR81_16015 [Longimicrobium sp.]|nr:hypothetical protein [Longimicrobium sp.]